MMTPHDQCLSDLRVSDVMQRHVISIPVHATMGEAAQQLCEHEISGAPVVDEAGRCVGVLSASDFTRRQHDEDPESLSPCQAAEFAMSQDQFRGPMQIHYVPEDSVERHMTPQTQTITAEQSLLEAARCMSGGHVSRLIVLDESSRPLGVVTALDLLAAWVRVSDAAEA